MFTGKFKLPSLQTLLIGGYAIGTFALLTYESFKSGKKSLQCCRGYDKVEKFNTVYASCAYNFPENAMTAALFPAVVPFRVFNTLVAKAVIAMDKQ